VEVVFALALAFQAMPERLAAFLVTVPMALEQALSFSRQRDCVLARAGHPMRLDQTLFPQVSEVT
jgi:hypothetical protein